MPTNAGEMLTPQELRKIADAHVKNCCPDPLYACGGCKDEAEGLRKHADWLEQERALKQPRLTREQVADAIERVYAPNGTIQRARIIIEITDEIMKLLEAE